VRHFCCGADAAGVIIVVVIVVVVPGLIGLPPWACGCFSACVCLVYVCVFACGRVVLFACVSVSV
jgi:hypothetical protein